jgi:deoxyribodipyrimidine photo-lyase
VVRLYGRPVSTAILWLRRDLRLADHPALLAAADEADEVLPLFVLDDVLRRLAGAPRLAFLYRCLRDLSGRTGGALRIIAGRPEQVLPELVRATGAGSVHISADAGPYGRERDTRVSAALEVPLVATGSPYAVTPGTLRKTDGTPYRVYTPFAKAWWARGVRGPAPRPEGARWTDGGQPTEAVPDDPDLGSVVLPPAGEAAALAQWRRFTEAALSSYDRDRNAPAVDGTSGMSVHLKYGCIHPRTMLADLGASDADRKLAGELIWRDFYADVLWHRPDAARTALNPAMAGMAYDADEERFRAWAAGRTGYPFVDAGMRQLLGEAWVHNRVRMVVASFLVKDLHLDWRRGARHFMAHLRDGDLASNSQGWQWVAGTGTDAAPYFRVFNPVKQGLEHDPHGDYVRRWVPELRDVPGPAVHEPWRLAGGAPGGYPEPIVDHAVERAEALRRYADAKG